MMFITETSRASDAIHGMCETETGWAASVKSNEMGGWALSSRERWSLEHPDPQTRFRKLVGDQGRFRGFPELLEWWLPRIGRSYYLVKEQGENIWKRVVSLFIHLVYAIPFLRIVFEDLTNFKSLDKRFTELKSLNNVTETILIRKILDYLERLLKFYLHEIFIDVFMWQSSRQQWPPSTAWKGGCKMLPSFSMYPEFPVLLLNPISSASWAQFKSAVWENFVLTWLLSFYVVP